MVVLVIFHTYKFIYVVKLGDYEIYMDKYFCINEDAIVHPDFRWHWYMMQNLYPYGHKLELILARHLISDSNNSGKSINPCRMSLIWVHVSGLTVWGNSWRKKTLYAISKLGLRIFWFCPILRSFFWLNQQTNKLLLYLFNINTLVFVKWS